MAATAPQISLTDYKVDTKPTWCPGCGDYAVLTAIQKALSDLQIPPHQVAVVSGIGCSSNLPHFLRAFGVHSLHGRALPVAQGIKLANPDLHVIAVGGDGDGYGIGQGHFIHAMRRNIDITYIVMNNEIYGLTTGQTSPTSLKGMATKSTPNGNIENPVNPVGLALMAGATYVARGFSGDPKNLAELYKNGIAHKGFSLIDTQSPCVTYNKLNTYDYFRGKYVNIQTEGHDHSNFEAAVRRSLEWPTLLSEKIPFGLFYETKDKRTYDEDELAYKVGNPLHGDLALTKDEAKSLLESLM
ncbi:MAG TPA: thiamine pyrophosphate-dependent enzyme [Candidatus Thermoplasmatota archaeon]|nr:thiamine pyrophosphate-dependent enzyme [Candidatus Thermoplasmatota archaeon]